MQSKVQGFTRESGACAGQWVRCKLAISQPWAPLNLLPTSLHSSNCYTPGTQYGVLIKCDASIKAIIVRIDADQNDIIVDDLDDEHLLIKEAKLAELKQRLSETLKATLREPESSNSE
ncbi:uncharacterized protein BDZ99DRAFT_517953 [Mytilinidion resinicola]|uniref:General transcription and DNA repair factor IIH subunit TFB5 n=1 Tax=Mytilinidion resinicola TaxID=574789 RepID=A0A6A6YVR3_9PEZI|nr:uncharacterized protein BDZ99DRAFT_517953 [Mytilinidion resinicola]KAF2812084.1 hypothetical protein BDZ99DRAFT_517953 [Mytilinidion resinicola]